MFFDASDIKTSIYGLIEAEPDEIGTDLWAEVLAMPSVQYSDVTTHRGVFHIVIGSDPSDPKCWDEIIADTEDEEDGLAILEALYDHVGVVG